MQIILNAKQYLRKSMIVTGRSFGRGIKTSVHVSSPKLCNGMYEDLQTNNK